jgi:site-specific recombinase XerD
MRKKITYTLVRRLKPAEKPYQVTDSELPNFKARVQPSGAIIYQFRRGRSEVETLGHHPETTPEQARAKAEKLLGARAGASKRRDRVLTFSEFLDGDYQAHVNATMKAANKALYRLESMRSEFGTMKLTAVDSKAVERWRRTRLTDGLAQGTVDRDVAELRAMLNRAAEWNIIDENPMRSVKLLRPQNERNRYLKPAEETRLRKALLDAPAYLHAMTVVTMNTGLRFGELASLTWDRVDLDNNTITVLEKSRRQNKTRVIPLNDEARDTLAGWKASKRAGDELVFPGRDGGLLTNVKRSWASVLKAAAIADFAWHDLRHHFASRLVQNGVDLYAVQKLLGHSSNAMTQRYAHLASGQLADAVARL